MIDGGERLLGDEACPLESMLYEGNDYGRPHKLIA